MVRYTLLRTLVFFGCLLILWLAGLRSRDQLFLLVAGAALISMVVSYFVLRPSGRTTADRSPRSWNTAPSRRQPSGGQALGRGHRGRRDRRG